MRAMLSLFGLTNDHSCAFSARSACDAVRSTKDNKGEHAGNIVCVVAAVRKER